MAMGQQDLVQGHVVRPAPVDAGEELQDLALLAGGGRVDQVEPVALAHGVRLHDRGAQAPQPCGQLLQLHRHRSLLSHPNRRMPQRVWRAMVGARLRNHEKRSRDG
jgi:hypothetical protein